LKVVMPAHSSGADSTASNASPSLALAASVIAASSSRRGTGSDVAVNRGRDKEALARSLGAGDYIDSEAGDPAQALQAMGGAKAIIATVTSPSAMQAVVGGRGVNGTLMVIGTVGALTVNSFHLLEKRAAVNGWYSGTASDSEDTLEFSRLNGITSMNEVYLLDQAQAAYDRMMSGKARFRVVLKVD
jgi:D-arabinose 1-dehydrogenase-like Zn-dependent alcohol dehydrogenase